MASIPLPKVGLLGLSTTLICIYLGLLWRIDDVAHLGMSLLFLVAAGSITWERRRQLPWSCDRIGLIVGGSLLLLTLAISGWLASQGHPDSLPAGLPRQLFQSLLRVLPFLSALTLACLAAGWQHLRQFWREVVIMAALGIPSILASITVDISPITARFSTLLLWYGGFQVVRQDLIIALPGGGVEVYAGCSGMESMTYLLGLSAICLIMFPIRGMKAWLTPLLAIALGFIINGIRVALMAVLAATNNTAAFDYWHEGDGSLLFGLFAVLAFGGLYMGLLTLDSNKPAAATQIDPLEFPWDTPPDA